MATTAQEYDGGQLCLLVVRERELTRQLAETQAEIAALRARLAALAHPKEGQGLTLDDDEDSDIIPQFPMDDESSQSLAGGTHPSRPYLMLQPLSDHDALRAKWKLGAGLPVPSASPASGLPASMSASRIGGTLRLFGLVDEGEAWECRVPFSRIAQDGGLILGRAGGNADVIVNESSVSRRHACLELTDAGLVITDLGSTNGMRLDERRLTPYERQVPLYDGATIALGEARLCVEIIP